MVYLFYYIDKHGIFGVVLLSQMLILGQLFNLASLFNLFYLNIFRR